MATQQTRALGRLAVAPAVISLFLWMIVPLAMTVWFSFLNYNLLDPNVLCSVTMPSQLLNADNHCFAGTFNYENFFSDPDFEEAIINSLVIVAAVLVASVGGGTLLALLLDQPIAGRNIVRLMVIAPFFVMPTVSALVWKNMMMDPVAGMIGWLMRLVGLQPISWLEDYPLQSVIIMVAWQWLPFATLIILTALQSLDEEQKEAAQMDGTPPLSFFFYIVLPHLARPITVVVLIETIFLLNVFAEIFVTGTGGPAGNLPYLVYYQGLQNFDVGAASAGGIVAVVLANIVAIFLIRMIGKNLEA